MTKDEILAMKPGCELNNAVAERVMGLEVICDAFMGDTVRCESEDGESIWSEVFPYSEDINTAQSVVNEMISRGYEDAAFWQDYGDGAYTPAEAICKRALLAVSGIEG